MNELRAWPWRLLAVPRKDQRGVTVGARRRARDAESQESPGCETAACGRASRARDEQLGGEMSDALRAARRGVKMEDGGARMEVPTLLHARVQVDASLAGRTAIDAPRRSSLACDELAGDVGRCGNAKRTGGSDGRHPPAHRSTTRWGRISDRAGQACRAASACPAASACRAACPSSMVRPCPRRARLRPSTSRTSQAPRAPSRPRTAGW